MTAIALLVYVIGSALAVTAVAVSVLVIAIAIDEVRSIWRCWK